MSHLEYNTYLDIAVELVRKAGQLIKAGHGKAKNISEKAGKSYDLVTETDVAAENLLIAGIKAKYPDHRFLAEESYPGPGKFTLTPEPTWIIDPIDGTTNFVHGIPMVAISVGLFINSAPVLGIIFNPITDQLYTAVKGQGAFLNGNPIRVSGETEMKKSLVLYDIMSIGIAELDDKRIRNVKKLRQHSWVSLSLVRNLIPIYNPAFPKCSINSILVNRKNRNRILGSAALTVVFWQNISHLKEN